MGQVDMVDKVDKVHRVDNLDQVDKVDRVDKVDKVNKMDKKILNFTPCIFFIFSPSEEHFKSHPLQQKILDFFPASRNFPILHPDAGKNFTFSLQQ